MAKIAGKNGSVNTATTVAGISSWTIDYTVDELESTDFAAVGVKTFLTGGSGWSGSFGGYKDGAPQTLGAAAYVTLKLYEDATYYWTGSAYITGVHGTTAHDGVVSYSYDYRGTGALTVPTG